MTDRSAQTLLNPGARSIGAVYLLYFLLAIPAGYMAASLVVANDAAATAQSILSHETQYRLSIALSLAANVVYMILAVLLYGLFEPVGRKRALLAAFVATAGCAIQLFAGILQLAPLVLLTSSPVLKAFDIAQLQATATLSLKLYSQAFNVSLVLFALFDLLIGDLIASSTFLPSILGFLMTAAGVGWLAYIWPPFASSVSAYVLPFGFLAELLLMLWLLVMGVNLARWREAAASDKAGGAG